MEAGLNAKGALNADGGFGGVFTLHIEQYGLKANDKKCDVKIIQEGDYWQIWVRPLTGLETPQFKQFVESLNQYLFSVLHITPSPEDVSLSTYISANKLWDRVQILI